MEFLAEYWMYLLGGGAFIAGVIARRGSTRNSGEVGGLGLGDWLSGDGDGGGGGD